MLVEKCIVAHLLQKGVVPMSEINLVQGEPAGHLRLCLHDLLPHQHELISPNGVNTNSGFSVSTAVCRSLTRSFFTDHQGEHELDSCDGCSESVGPSGWPEISLVLMTLPSGPDFTMHSFNEPDMWHVCSVKEIVSLGPVGTTQTL